MQNNFKNKITPVIGLQWGDEGKGKGVACIAAGLSARDLIVRFQGGNNAGHTIWQKGRPYVFKLTPSGIFGKPQIHLGAGMVVNPAALLEEVKSIPRKISFLPRLSVSPHAVLTLPTHILLDMVSEGSKGKSKIGSTGRGISPSYTDLTLRRALRVGDIFQKDFKQKYRVVSALHLGTLKNEFKHEPKKNELKQSEEKFWQGIRFLKRTAITDSARLVESTLSRGGKVIAEGER